MARNDSPLTIEIITQTAAPLATTLLRIEQEAFAGGGLDRWSLPVFLSHGRVYLARWAGETVAVAELLRDWSEPGLAYLYGLAVAPEYRGRGIGGSLLQKILADLPAAGITRLQLTVAPDNSAALHLYCEKFGMQQLALHKDYYGPGEDRWLVEWVPGEC